MWQLTLQLQPCVFTRMVSSLYSRCLQVPHTALLSLWWLFSQESNKFKIFLYFYSTHQYSNACTWIQTRSEVTDLSNLTFNLLTPRVVTSRRTFFRKSKEHTENGVVATYYTSSLQLIITFFINKVQIGNKDADARFSGLRLMSNCSCSFLNTRKDIFYSIQHLLLSDISTGNVTTWQFSVRIFYVCHNSDWLHHYIDQSRKASCMHVGMCVN